MWEASTRSKCGWVTDEYRKQKKPAHKIKQIVDWVERKHHGKQTRQMGRPYTQLSPTGHVPKIGNPTLYSHSSFSVTVSDLCTISFGPQSGHVCKLTLGEALKAEVILQMSRLLHNSMGMSPSSHKMSELTKMEKPLELTSLTHVFYKWGNWGPETGR